MSARRNLKAILHTVWLPVVFAGLLLCWSYWTFPVAIAALLDARARLQELAWARKYSYSFHLSARFCGSRCQRNMYAGLHKQAGRDYYNMGYRWWHFLPDKLMASPLEFFSVRNMRKVLGV